MILLFHLFIGAVIAAKIKYLPLVILIAFLGHYFLDLLPHNEYLLENIKKKKWKKSGTDFLKLIIDLTIGLVLILFTHYITRTNYSLIAVSSFFSILPDILLVLREIFPTNKILEKNLAIHKKIHFLKYKKIPLWGRLITQLMIILIGFAVILI